MTGAELERLLFEHMPEEVFVGLLRSNFTAHAVAAEECAAAFEKEEVSNVIPFYRRAKFEALMRDTAARTGAAESRVVRTKGGWKHTQLWSGPVVLTSNSVQTPCGRVEPSEERITLAQSSQGLLWPEPGDAPSEDSPLYVMFLHSRSVWVKPEDRQRFGHLPGSAYLAFPAPDWSDYVHTINLYKRFPAVVASLLPKEWNDEAVVRFIHRSSRAITA